MKTQFNDWSYAGSVISAPDPERADGSYERITIASQVYNPEHGMVLVMATRMKAVLEEFVNDVEAAYGSDVFTGDLGDEWPDLLVTYEKAVAVLKEA